ncbi:hypothetical protein GGS24DRAFT_487561 [Hypoxylon argillaceum]|nr:hypothetical protein GGS24DRAFT_487561 [Hypoxylon argillaceum]KAI1148534.1 hypothetical protein F4825DRAFT_464832 [Nemania diffusa]
MESAATQSILSRRPAAGGLPQFHLPPPTSSLDSQIPRVSDSISPPSSSLNSNSSHSPHTGVTQYNNQSGWSVPNTSSYTYGSVTPGAQSSVMSSNYSRHLYSPSGPGASGGTGQPGYSSRSSQSPATADGLPPSYDSVNHPFPMSITGGGASHSSFSTQPSHSQHLQHAILSSQTSQPPSPAVTASSETYSRAPPTPGYYTASSSTPQQTPYPAFHPPHPSPTQLSPATTGGSTRGIPALSSQHHAPMGALPPYGNRHYNYSTTVSGMGSMVLSNMGNPGGQMHLMGAANPLNTYHHTGHPLPHHGIYAGAPNSQQDRPYRCDTCPQSFSRNHDLKRHKRIHLAIKPYPCEYCDKAFSRRDALKRHRLVKGCGNNGKTSPKSGNGGSPEPEPKRDPDGPSGSSGGIKAEPV